MSINGKYLPANHCKKRCCVPAEYGLWDTKRQEWVESVDGPIIASYGYLAARMHNAINRGDSSFRDMEIRELPTPPDTQE